jgi:ketopantoate reductase
MKICVFGAGAVGGLMATKFALAGADVTVIERGPQLAAINTGGIRLEWQDGRVESARMKAVGNAADAGAQDLVVLAVKAHSLAQVATDIPSLLAPETVVMPVQNGIPWWYFEKHGGALEGTRLLSLDPDGALADAIDVDRIVSCIVYPAAIVVAPGVIRHIEGNFFPIGELDGKRSPRVRAIDAVFAKAGMRSRVMANIRAEIWLKALGTLSFNPISALTRATMADICTLPETRQLATAMMREAETVAAQLGI